MAFSIFSKKGSEPPKPSKPPTPGAAKPDAAAKTGSQAPAPSRSVPPLPKPAALAPEAMSSRINAIEAEMDELDFTALTAQPVAPRPRPPSNLPDTVIGTPPPEEDAPAPRAPVPVAAGAAVSAAVASAVTAGSAKAGAAVAAPATAGAAPVAQRSKLVIEHGFNPALKPAARVAAPPAQPAAAPAPAKAAAPAAMLPTPATLPAAQGKPLAVAPAPAKSGPPAAPAPAKSAPPAAAAVAKPAAAKPSAPGLVPALVPALAPAVRATPAPSPAPASAPVPVRAPAPAPASAPIAVRPSAPVAAPVKAPVSSKTPPANADSALTSLGVSSVMMRELALSPFESAPVLEQAALLYAEGRAVEARTALEAALKAGKMPQAAAHQAWLLLFDLLENLGEEAVFEAAAIDFAVAFETSPPAFNNRSGVSDPMLDTGGGQYYAINGALDAAIAPQLARLGEIALHSKIMRIEFAKIKSVAEPGCTLLLARLRAFKKAGIDLVFSNIGHLAGLLSGAIETGRRTDPEVFWLLLLELQQFLGQQEVFEETALNYCITYEVSPPQWAAPAHPAKTTPPKGAAAAGSSAAGAPLPQDALYLKGTLQSAADPRFAAINTYAASRPLVVLDLFDLRRMDPAAASEFINVLSALYVKNKELELRSPSPLIATLLISMGFTEQARFTQRAA